MKSLKRIITSLLFFSTGILLINCSPQKFAAIDPMQKASTLDSHAGLSDSDDFLDGGFGNHQNDTDSGQNSNNQDDNGHFNDFSITTTGPNPQSNDNSDNDDEDEDNNDGVEDDSDNNTATNVDTTLKVKRWCRGADKGGSLLTSNSVTIKLFNDKTDQLICTVSGASVLDEIMSHGEVTFKNCDLSGISKIGVKAFNEKNKSLEKNDGINNLTLNLILDKDVNKNKLHKKCDQYMSSPLVVDMRNRSELSKAFTLTAPIDGQYFDILGANSNPTPYTKKLISKIEDPRVMPIVLFDKTLEFGIDQLFGDNTLGPDGQFADNGFAALAKYDGLNLRTNKVTQADGVIDKEDEVYHLLSLWFDKNMDNKVQKSELISLKSVGITLIDLDYDKDHYSRDQYGNEIKYKSVVKTRNGALRPVFDVWYMVDERIQ